MKKVLIVTLAALACAACKGRNKNPVTNVQQATADRDLQASFQSECNTRLLQSAADWTRLITREGPSGDALERVNRSTPGSVRVEYKFQGANVTRTTVYYNGTRCEGELLKFEERGDFRLQTDRRSNDGGKQIDMHFKKVMATPVGQYGPVLANGIRLCGDQNWSSDQQRDVTGSSGASTCYGTRVPRDVYDLYRVDGNSLYLGSDPSEGNRSSDRPTRVLSGSKFSKK